MNTLENTTYYHYCKIAAMQLCKAIANDESASKVLDDLSTNHNVEKQHIKECFYNLINEG